jgi:hypothetical protein
LPLQASPKTSISALRSPSAVGVETTDTVQLAQFVARKNAAELATLSACEHAR